MKPKKPAKTKRMRANKQTTAMARRQNKIFDIITKKNPKSVQEIAGKLKIRPAGALIDLGMLKKSVTNQKTKNAINKLIEKELNRIDLNNLQKAYFRAEKKYRDIKPEKLREILKELTLQITKTDRKKNPTTQEIKDRNILAMHAQYIKRKLELL